MPLVRRHFAKTVSYRILGTLTTVGISLACGLPVKMAGMLGFGELVLKPVIYFLHERFWYKFVKYGLIKRDPAPAEGPAVSPPSAR